jgi:nitroimidazol reductase NimA-like FMN-containing flavoprotein (pyridoxamine 5'-phosphate oxidase superfamily)
MVELTRAESLRLLGNVPFGRIVFTRQAMPAIRPVNHIVDDDAIILRTHLGAALLTNVGLVVAYEADDIDPVEQVGWSVIVTGLAVLVRNADETARYERMLRPWVNGEKNQIVRIQPEFVTGYRLTRESDARHMPA